MGGFPMILIVVLKSVGRRLSMLDGSLLRQTTRQWERRGQRGQDTGCSTCPTLQLLGQVEPSVIAIRDACCLQPARRLGTPKNNERCAGRWSAKAVAHHLMKSVRRNQILVDKRLLAHLCRWLRWRHLLMASLRRPGLKLHPTLKVDFVA